MAPYFGLRTNLFVMKSEQPEIVVDDSMLLGLSIKDTPLLVDLDTAATDAVRSAKCCVANDLNKSADDNQAIAASPFHPRRELLRQVSMRLYLKGKDVAHDVLRNVAPFRLADAEEVCSNAHSSLEHEIRNSKKMRKHLWLPKTQDDSVLQNSSSQDQSAVAEFFVARVTDPTSYFYRFHYDDYHHLAVQKAEVQLVDIKWLKPHEQVVSWERVNGLRKAILSWDAYTEPLLVDVRTGAILDGHHRYHVALQLRLQQVPAVLVDYLGDKTIQVDVWPGCGRSQLTKEEVIAMALSPDVFPPKTSRHKFSESLPPISIPLSILRQVCLPVTPVVPSEEMQKETLHLLERKPSLQNVSILLICGAQNLAASVTKSLFRGRLRLVDRIRKSTRMDLISRPSFDPNDFFNAIRENDLTSSFCQQKAATLEDLLSDNKERREKFFLTRIADPTSYFYKYHFDARPQRQPKKLEVHLASLSWLKAHEHVVSWDRVEGLRRATVRWNAYLEPLLVDRATGAILDGHHRYHVGIQLELASVPVVLVNYLEDESITVEVWPNCGRDSLTKQQVIDMSLSDDLFPPKTSRHSYSDDLPPISVSLDRLRIPLTKVYTTLN
ncbi:transcriptional regulator [Plasmopara halstedii]|uniref:Transcriptional regulator n=1 Tax=Plasmopara halstedii TaxID=4781 RepID=A0A0P1B437_PLAHL|nr:transcriptional regulator [Plasmopara halstedii]CEG48337.1 transcriptional regulator [Plasmopara halstedii]|eukprot:XP_024584706.1 transcriptional regulator [Plasmopara halstedii]